MTPDEFAAFDGLGLADLVRRGEVTALDLVNCAVARAEAVNPRLNAIVAPLYEEARRAAVGAVPQGPFAGVPFLLKDLLAALAGAPLSNGSRFFRGFTPDHDSELVARYRAAGLIFIGKTNTPEFGLTPYTEPEAFGPARNPWDIGRTPGGSSGGSAAAVAAGIVPMAHGGDGGGSIRIPASACGLFGFKPSRGRVPVGPDFSELWHGVVVEHALTRSVRDSAALLDVVAGPETGGLHDLPPAQGFLAEATRPPGRLRIAVPGPLWTIARPHPDCQVAVDEAARLLGELGHRLEPAMPDIDLAHLHRQYIIMLAGETAAEVRFSERLLGRKARAADLELPTRALALIGRSISAEEYAGAIRDLHEAGRLMARFMARHDAILTPTLGKPPVRIGALTPPLPDRAAMALFAAIGAGGPLRRLGAVERIAQPIFDFIPYTAMANITGQPAMSLPLHWNAEGLPIGVQVMGRMGDEATLFRLAGQIEAARPWFDRRPNLP